MSKFYSARRVVIYELEGNKIPIIKSIIDTNPAIKERVKSEGVFLYFEEMNDTYDDKFHRTNDGRIVPINSYNIYMSIGSELSDRFYMGYYGFDDGTTIEEIIEFLLKEDMMLKEKNTVFYKTLCKNLFYD